MPDLRALMAAEAHRLGPDSIPAFDDLQARSRRRRAARATATVTGVVVTVAAVAVGGWWLSPRPSTRVAVSAPVSVAPSTATHVSAPGVPTEVYARLRALAVALATNNGDPNPTRMEAVKVNPTRPAASRQPSPSSPPLTGGYLLQVQGHFVCGFCKAHAELRATVISQQVSAPGLTVLTTGFGGPWQDLTRYGTPYSLTLPAAPVTVAAGTVSPAVTASVPASAGPAAPDPTTLAEAEQRARQATTDPAHATIEAASAATAAKLRIAGLAVPPAVKASTVMFVVVVDGTTVLSSGAGQQSAQSPRFAVVFNSDGSGRGDQAVYHGAFGLPDSPNATSPVATVVLASQLSSGPLSWTPAPAGSLAHAVPVAVALRAVPHAQFPSLAKPLAALVYVTTLHVTHRLAWVIETYGSLIEGGRGPLPNNHAVGDLRGNETVVDATTGRYLEATSF